MISQIPSKIEFAVQVEGKLCVEKVKNQLNTSFGIKSEDIETVLDSKNKECRLVISSVKVNYLLTFYSYKRSCNECPNNSYFFFSHGLNCKKLLKRR